MVAVGQSSDREPIAATPTDATAWRVHDDKRPVPEVVKPAKIDEPVPAPSDAIMLFDGTSLTEWVGADGQPTRWVLSGGSMIATEGSGGIQTKRSFGDVQLHLEWATPSPPAGKGQGRGNSGVYFMSKYELQILDSFENKTYADGQAASIYGQSPPLVNACLPPGAWQSFDVVFHAPRFGPSNELIQPATMTVFHNGVLVQDHFALWGPTNWLKHDRYKKHDAKMPLMLQDHGNPVQFRNIWVRELAERSVCDAPGECEPKLELTEEQLNQRVGSFRHNENSYRIRNRKGRLQLGFEGRFFDLVPVTETEFGFRTTKASVEFTLNANGEATAIVVDLMGDKRTAVRE